ncbi:YggS family pyridoxal phosphate-dependent enzyme [Oculatella sp. FACHB-28]|uniref:YggS family pyridoxal phosphate-dependent enzyme n=1 Tax=Cyanophyceae TaxID=3028117 RepID=UPI001686FA9D|nr:MULTISPECIES: YggS family pyridoxal phosphate-dependent enzyme [Cyanophyceae]MBD1871743.1 YggS family pyridoxal phosphate-dependent enzyme [Cyanobacteria bacterium FACHB-471]MBD1996617.1 YggS family pyridoxal phosphate-dependent enzyme [Leptolyngbya sp. FACHB-541]MBD2057750.1 YggS family pyridoxal phosphate-dependent enzyme [Oculatella sp. FACHB-28]MBD2069754.1 YggS family pyridoxal phosphate-dependent enzyme [Leptolyngbya sp. FACHB-671]
MSAIAERLAQIRQTLPPSTRLIAVTKQVSVEAMRDAYAAGVRDFGESRIQEATQKQDQLQDLTDIRWHLIGHLQTNKAAKALELFQWIHSLDSLKLAQRLDQLAANLPQKPNLCLQVKILPDPNKYGWTISELLDDLPQLDQYSHLNIVGLMAIPPYGLDPHQTLSVFTQTHDLAEKIRQQSWHNIQMQELSIGMSGDYPLAVQAGATMIRLGRILFGERA